MWSSTLALHQPTEIMSTNKLPCDRVHNWTFNNVVFLYVLRHCIPTYLEVWYNFYQWSLAGGGEQVGLVWVWDIA